VSQGTWRGTLGCRCLPCIVGYRRSTSEDSFGEASGYKMVDTLTILKTGLVLLKPIGWIKDKWETVIGPWKTMPALLQRVDTLEARTSNPGTLEKEKKRYKLVNIENGLHVYALKPEMAGDDAPHYCCAHCFDDLLDKARKSVLQPVQQKDFYQCPACKTTFNFTTLPSQEG